MAAIVLLEDDERLAKQISVSLAQVGHEVTMFDAATPALAHCENHAVDLIIADLFIKKGGAYIQDAGIRLMSSLRQVTGSDLPMIAISGSFSDIHGEAALGSAIAVGATETLAKPFHPDELIELVESLLAGDGG